MTITVTVAAKTHSRLGEGAFWDHSLQRLWWVDIYAGLIHRFDPESGRNETFDFGEAVGCVAPRVSGGLVVAAKTGVYLYDPETGVRECLCHPEADLVENRANDGCTDPMGRFWFGTMKDGGPFEARGSFYRLDPDMTLTKWRGNVGITNGLAFSPDGHTMYCSDSHPKVRTIWAYEYDFATGTPSGQRVFFDTTAVAGRPDGGTVDSEGCYWQAGVSGWEVYRISPQGKVLLTIPVPVEKPSKPMFGGANLDTLYLTSIGEGFENDPAQPLAGCLFAITGHGTRGVSQALFGG